MSFSKKKSSLLLRDIVFSRHVISITSYFPVMEYTSIYFVFVSVYIFFSYCLICFFTNYFTGAFRTFFQQFKNFDKHDYHKWLKVKLGFVCFTENTSTRKTQYNFSAIVLLLSIYWIYQNLSGQDLLGIMKKKKIRNLLASIKVGENECGMFSCQFYIFHLTCILQSVPTFSLLQIFFYILSLFYLVSVKEYVFN